MVLRHPRSTRTYTRFPYTTLLRSIPETFPADLFNAGPPDDTERRIVEIEASLRELLSQYTEKHPDVVTLRRQMASLLAKQEAARKEIAERSEEHTSELQSLMRISYAVFCLKKKNTSQQIDHKE